MGYSGRYHAASLAAVFLALAVGILIGVGFGSDIVNGTADDLEKSLATDLDQARAEADDLRAQLASERAFEDAVSPALVADQLRGRRVALVGLGSLDPATANDVESALGSAGGDLAEVAVVREPPDLDALAGTVEGHRARALAHGDEAALRTVGQRAGRTLIRGGPGFDELRGTLLSRFSGSPERIDGVVVARGRPEDLDPKQESATAALEEGLIAGFTDSAITVGVETVDADPSSVAFFDGRGLATVDSVDRLSGQVALVFALGGASGNFGVKESADSLLPDLLPGQAAGRRAGAASRTAGGPG